VEKLLLRVPEAAEIASVGRTTAYELIGSGAWPVVRIGTAVRVHAEGLRAWVEAQKEGGQTRRDVGAAPPVIKRDIP